jgi:DNA-binding CsgD family transcriptional regulator
VFRHDVARGPGPRWRIIFGIRWCGGQSLDGLLTRERQPTYIPTRREYEVLALLAAGYPMKQIAYRLGITYSTVTFHKYGMMERLGIRTNAGPVQYAMRNGVLEQDTAGKNLAAA